MWELFSTNSDTAGFRLQYMEVLNWGTFHKEIVRIAPQGNNSLLTGANASGKSTFIDALLTLLVPMHNKRFYNQSSGVERRGDRTEESYVLGYYGNILKEGSSSTTTQMLREKQNTYSIILASFSSTTQQTVTLFQLRWFSGTELKKNYGIAHLQLEIAKDFPKFDSGGDWKKLLDAKYNYDKSKRKQVEFFSGPKDYQSAMCSLFGMRSENAFSLFNQMVGVKVLDDLDDFISTHMLEERNTEETYKELRTSFFTLTEANDNIEKAKLQVEWLTPICQDIEALQQATQQGKELVQLQSESVYGFAKKYVSLATDEIAEQTALLEEVRQRNATLQKEAEALSVRYADLEQDIRNDAVGKQIEMLKKEKRENLSAKEERMSNAEQYNKIVASLGLMTDPDEETFKTNRTEAQLLFKGVHTEELLQEDNIRKLTNENEEIVQQMDALRENIDMLRKNKNNISGREATIRDEILLAVGATKEEIPFIGELIRVKEAESAWEYVIEKVLHQTALHLVVPPKFYSKVNAYVNTHNLKGRIRYYKYEQPAPKIFQMPQKEQRLLINKIEIKPKHPYSLWVEYLIENQHNFVCVEELSEFEQFVEMALTPKGLVKYRKGKHEKDDREAMAKRSNYVLGWDNKEKLSELSKELVRLQETKKKNDTTLKTLQLKREELRSRQFIISNLNDKFTKFDTINWQVYALKIQELETAIDQLEQTNNRIKALGEQLRKVKEKQAALKATIKEEEKKEFVIEQAITNITEKKQQHQDILETNPEVDTALFVDKYSHLLELSYANIETYRQAFASELAKQIEQNKQLINKKEMEITRATAKFRNPPAAIIEKFKDWAADVYPLPEKTDPVLLTEYQHYLDKLKKDNLPKYEKKFRDYLHETTIHKMGSFATFFDSWAEEIRENIRQLNESLKEINFNTQPDTYIQLVHFQRESKDVAEFKDLLRRARVNINEFSNQEEGRRLHFEQHIAPFIKRLENETWRKRVLDVRQWFSYKAEESFRETGTKAKTYERMGQLSGGEKAQLTYTILGSALAYQFGMLKDGMQGNSFRFIAIDEAFKAQDEERAYYLITLCRQLHLQLLVVTPSDNIHIVENDIAFVHFVSRAKNKTSHLINMPIEQFKAEREKYFQS